MSVSHFYQLVKLLFIVFLFLTGNKQLANKLFSIKKLPFANCLFILEIHKIKNFGYNSLIPKYSQILTQIYDFKINFDEKRFIFHAQHQDYSIDNVHKY